MNNTKIFDVKLRNIKDNGLPLTRCEVNYQDYCTNVWLEVPGGKVFVSFPVYPGSSEVSITSWLKKEHFLGVKKRTLKY